MACTKVINSSTVGLFLDDVLVAYSNDVSITITHEVRDTTNKDSVGWKDSMQGLRSWEASVSGWYATDDSSVSTLLNDSIITRAQVGVKIQVHSSVATDLSGASADDNGVMNKVFSGNAWVSNVGVNANGAEGNADFSASLIGCGALTYT